MKVLRKAFKEQLDDQLTEFVSSVEADEHLIEEDLLGSLAHVQMLSASSLITSAQADNIVNGLNLLQKQAAKGEFHLDPDYEDVHMNVEKKLEELIGDDTKLLHTARSRNDQVAVDLRLFVSAKARRLIELLSDLEWALLEKAEEHIEVVLPGYTHLQRAQPISFGHAMHAYIEMFERDAARLGDAIGRAATSPLGAGALAGSSLPIQPEISARVLGFENVFGNSIDAVSDRDFVAEFLFAAALTAIHLSQLAETLIIWCTKEFGFIEFPDSLTTSSSLMPQKKNPDPVELVRGKSGAIVGELVNLLFTLKSLPLGYNRDLQETKPPAIRVAMELSQSLIVMRKAIKGLTVKADKTLKAASDSELMCTDLVEYLVIKGVPFRSAHEAVSLLVQHGRDKGVPLPKLKLAEYKKFSEQFDEAVYARFDPVQSMNAKTSHGAAGIGQVKLALSRARTRLKSLPARS